MHDPRFKRLLQEFFAEFFWLFFPEWAARFDFGSVKWLDKELVSDALQGESRFVDIVAEVATLKPVSPQEGQAAKSWLALVHVEIESADSVEPLRERMFHYYEPLRRQRGLPVLPLALYLRVGLEGIGWDVYEEYFWEHRLVRFDYPYIGLPALDAQQYVRQDNWLGVALSALMKTPKERRIDLAGEAIERIVHCPENVRRRMLLCECVTAYLPVDEKQRQQFEDMLRGHPDPGVQAMSVGLLDDVRERGRLEGKLEGRLEGQRELLRKLIESRFGPLPTAAVAQLQAWPSDGLTKLGCAILSATSLEELGLAGSAAVDT